MNKFTKILDIASKIAVVLYILFTLFYCYETFDFYTCEYADLRHFLGLEVASCQTVLGDGGLGAAMSVVYTVLIGMVLIALLPLLIGLRVLVYFLRKRISKGS
ncbi:hypothetical protein QJU89_03110 [Pasteurella skyensis]|uniref:Uncharacterized protein n=1 Tax=Phocoenobacter skyensis TaxID=97481 RepID=A0AAJ6P164_9PAST|nr:hypothetical protein [Pasteurella skyensis]MDP8163223.1 hypothetical protein [Pasteurella skyensis]MDP8173310.1 hypothetical protein [Pasteurella skyensis]MDP8176985.1 hypothetical protein [Pasteurella skyensis]MDP8179720.1 hypothetical protein [Pasteurella skyensis]MDP8182687.1 hypothetical protein [Pasteurella skyensis]